MSTDTINLDQQYTARTNGQDYECRVTYQSPNYACEVWCACLRELIPLATLFFLCLPQHGVAVAASLCGGLTLANAFYTGRRFYQLDKKMIENEKSKDPWLDVEIYDDYRGYTTIDTCRKSELTFDLIKGMIDRYQSP